MMEKQMQDSLFSEPTVVEQKFLRIILRAAMNADTLEPVVHMQVFTRGDKITEGNLLGVALLDAEEATMTALGLLRLVAGGILSSVATGYQQELEEAGDEEGVATMRGFFGYLHDAGAMDRVDTGEFVDEPEPVAETGAESDGAAPSA